MDDYQEWYEIHLKAMQDKVKGWSEVVVSRF